MPSNVPIILAAVFHGAMTAPALLQRKSQLRNLTACWDGFLQVRGRGGVCHGLGRPELTSGLRGLERLAAACLWRRQMSGHYRDGLGVH